MHLFKYDNKVSFEINMVCLKYIFVVCIALALMLKVGHSATSIFLADVYEITLEQEESEKEENKIESDYFITQTIQTQLSFYSSEVLKPLLPGKGFFHISFYPEILTPPPSPRA